MYDSTPLIAAGALPFSVGKKDQCRDGTPAAMKGSARAKTVIAAPVNAEERLLKVCASVADKNNCALLYSPSCAALDRAVVLLSSQNKVSKPCT